EGECFPGTPCNRYAGTCLITFGKHNETQPQEHCYEKQDDGFDVDSLTHNGRCVRSGLASMARAKSRCQSFRFQGAEVLAQGIDPEMECHGWRGCCHAGTGGRQTLCLFAAGWKRDYALP